MIKLSGLLEKLSEVCVLKTKFGFIDHVGAKQNKKECCSEWIRKWNGTIHAFT